MRDYRRILVPIDFSETSLLAIEPAYSLAQLVGGMVFLVHSVDLPVVANPMYAHYSPEAIPSWGDRQKLETDLQSRLRALVPTDPTYADVHTQVRVLSEATPAEAIVEHATAISADLIIIGHKGWSTLANLLVGSTAERVLKHAPCPVMIVRAKG